MSISLENLAGSISAFFRTVGSTAAPGGGEGLLGTHLEDLNGKPLAVSQGQALNAVPYGMPMAGMNDNNALIMRVDRFGGLASALHVPQLVWMPEGATINTRLLTASTSGLAPTQTASTGLQLNPTAITTANAFALYTSRMRFNVSVKQPLLFRFKARIATLGVANAGFDAGFGAPATNAAPADGCIWRSDGSGTLPVLYINGSPVGTFAAVSGLVNTSYYFFDIIKDDDAYICSVQDPGTGLVLSRQVLQIPAGQARSVAASRLPVFVRAYTGGTIPSTAPNAFVVDAYVALLDTARGDSVGNIYAGAYGLGSETNPTTYVTTSNLVNSTVAAAITLSNTSPGSSLLDGAVRFPAPAGAVTDYTLFGHTVPSPFRLRTKGCLVAAKNLGAAVAGTPTQIDFFVACDAAVSLAGASTKRKYIGTQTFPVGAVIGAIATEGPISVDLSASDLVSEPSTAVHLVARISTGTATASQVIEVAYNHIGNYE